MFFKPTDKPEPAKQNAAQSDAQNVSPLFSMERIGLQIMNARKKKGITQMELADRMGISFQAVSNWERGLSCPDISKLFELSELFDVSIDELLGNPRAAQIATEIQDGTPPALPVEELTEVAPLLDQEQADQVVQKSLIEEHGEEPAAQTETSGSERFETIKQLLPFASRDMIDALASTLLHETMDPEQILFLAPFMHRDTVDSLVKELLEKTRDPAFFQSFLPFMHREAVDAIAISMLEEADDIEQINELLPFMHRETVDSLVKKLLEKNHTPADMQTLLPFIHRETADEIARALMEETQDLQTIQCFLPFMHREAVDGIVNSILEKTHDLDQIAPLLPFMSRSGVDNLLRSYLKQ